MGQGEFDRFRDFLEDACGISLGENKQYLVATRVKRILADNDIDNLSALIDRMRSGRGNNLREQVIDAMTTNETFWFRDTYPYEHLKNRILPQLCESGFGPLRIWSAACSSGQEPYSISMIFDEFKRKGLAKTARNLQITATDLSPTVLDQAKRAHYDKLSVMRGLSQERLRSNFDQVNDETWALKRDIVSRVEFKSLNLLDSFSSLGKFDIIFCRNVLIYFQADLKRDILSRMHAQLKPGGILFLGSSEGLAGLNDKFEMVSCNPGILYKAK